MELIKLDTSKVGIEITEEIKREAIAANELLHAGEGKGSDFLGWITLPSDIDEAHLAAINAQAAKLREVAEVVICIGIGGSYLGAKAVIDAMTNSFELFHKTHKNPIVLFAGQNISEDYLGEMMEALKDYSIATIVASKSGTTTEPAIAFRIVKEEIERRYGKEDAKNRIVAVTDKARGALKTMATQEGYPTFVIPDNVGGRFSVLSPVGLLPLAVGGVNIAELVAGAKAVEESTKAGTAYEDNISAQYAAVRNALYRAGKKIEILGSYEPKLVNINEWWKQLYGESEGKDGKGIYPASVTLTADLHSMGQYIQDGERTLMETVVSVEKSNRSMLIENDPQNLDGLNFLTGKHVEECNAMAELGTKLAHIDGGVPQISLSIERINEYNLGALFYFFEKACGISGYVLGVNPFDQPGVEAYKKNMFALLGKPGYEAQAEELRARL